MICEECKEELYAINGFYTCKKCGLTHEQQYVNPNFITVVANKNSELNRLSYYDVNSPVDIINYGSCIGFITSSGFKDYDGKAIPNKQGILYNRLRKTNNFAKIKNNETPVRCVLILGVLYNYFEIDFITRHLITATFKKYSTDPVVCNKVVLVAAVFYFSTRNLNIKMQELIKVMNLYGHRVSSKSIMKLLLLLKLNMKIKNSEDYIFEMLEQIFMSEIFLKKYIKKKIPFSVDTYKEYLLKTVIELHKKFPVTNRGSSVPYYFTAATFHFADILIAKKFNTKRVLSESLLQITTGLNAYTFREIYLRVLKTKVYGTCYYRKGYNIKGVKV